MRKVIAGWMLALSVATWLGFSLFLFGSRYDAVASRLAPAPLLEELPVTATIDVSSVLDTLGAEGREAYAAFQGLDSANAALAALVVAVLILFCVERFGRRTAWRGLAVVPLGLLAAEIVENVTISRLIAAYPEVAASSVTLLGTATRAKFVFGLISFLLAIACLFGAIVGSVRRRGFEEDDEPTLNPDAEPS
jgi:hypothetical protein